MSLDDHNDHGTVDDLLADDQDMPTRRATGPQQAIPQPSPFRGPVVTVLVAALSALATATIVRSCGSCVQLGTWTPPYQSTEAAAAEKKDNAEAHEAIRKDLRESVSTIRAEITSGNTAVLKAIANQQREPQRRPR